MSNFWLQKMQLFIGIILYVGIVSCSPFPESKSFYLYHYLESIHAPNQVRSSQYVVDNNESEQISQAIQDCNEKIEVLMGILLNFVHKDGTALLHHAISKGNAKFAEDWIKHGADINVRDDTGQTPLQMAVLSDHENIADLLIKNGADATISDRNGKTALYFAAENDNEIMAKKLIAIGSNVNGTDNKGRTALHIAALHGSEKVAEILLKSGINVNKTDDVGSTALHRAAEKGYEKIAEMLIKSGISINHRDSIGCSALHRSAEHGTSKVLDVLVKYKAEVNIMDNDERKPFDYANNSGHEREFTDVMEKNGKRVMYGYVVNDSEGLIYAVSEGNIERVKLINFNNVDGLCLEVAESIADTKEMTDFFLEKRTNATNNP